ncbi:MAG TPA: hypothetical protein PK595_06370 [Bacteroidota bacterium]|nr:hypothetical protein [Bacteroidota bacterium]
MTFKVKNTIYLAIVLGVFLLIGSGIYYFWQPKQLRALQKKQNQIERQLQDLPLLIEEVQRLTNEFQDVKRRYDSRSKVIPLLDVSSQTYDYMSQGIEEAGFLKFDMRFLGSDNRGKWGFNAYSLTQGEGEFGNLFKFIYFLENGSKLYKISSIEASVREKIDEETKESIRSVAFSMELHAYYVNNIPELSTSLAAKQMTVYPTVPDPFRPIVTEVIANQPPEGEIDADQCEVKAILPGKAFVLYSGELLVFHIGDRVWRGTVTEIDPQTSSVEFVLNEGGVVRKLVKKIKFEKYKTR